MMCPSFFIIDFQPSRFYDALKKLRKVQKSPKNQGITCDPNDFRESRFEDISVVIATEAIVTYCEFVGKRRL